MTEVRTRQLHNRQQVNKAPRTVNYVTWALRLIVVSVVLVSVLGTVAYATGPHPTYEQLGPPTAEDHPLIGRMQQQLGTLRR